MVTFSWVVDWFRITYGKFLQDAIYQNSFKSVDF